MGPNGSGKAHYRRHWQAKDDYQVDSGEIIFKGQDLTELDPEERELAKAYFWLSSTLLKFLGEQQTVSQYRTQRDSQIPRPHNLILTALTLKTCSKKKHNC